ncbi:hypothetical protein AVE81_004805 [Salmonella enterica subsp. diarizonae]|nr:hypothetical protein [Salmonella enterica subsp. diarizonae]ECF6072432.1 hypothetical protein [Salmonella enterica subsp. diarizonae]EDW9103837.1 hypothetical protein [Salmonella enterica subsp. diarizonae]
MTTVSKPRYVVQLIVFPKYLLNNIAFSEVDKEKIDKSEMIYMYIIYDTVDLIYKNSFPDDEKGALRECYKLNYSNISIYKAEVAKFEDGSPDKLKDITPYQKSEDSDEEYENLSDEEKVNLFEDLEKEHGVENIPPVKSRRLRP